MDERHDDRMGGDCPYEWLSEWLCEYVDGTMDPSVRAVFDEYLRANPELAEHVERLCEMRLLLCQCQEAPEPSEQMHRRADEIRRRLCRQLEEEMMQTRSPLPEGVGTVAAVASGMTAMLVVGMIVGASLFGAPAASRTPVAASTPERTEVRHPSARADRPPARAAFPAARFAPAVLTSEPAFHALTMPRLEGDTAQVSLVTARTLFLP